VVKARGTRLGNPNAAPARVLAAAANRAEAVRPLAERLAGQGLSLRAIARELEERRIPTARGGQWHAAGVRALLPRHETDRDGLLPRSGECWRTELNPA